MSFEIRDRRRGFLWLNNEIIDDFAQQLGPMAVLVYLYLCRYANNSTGICFPKQEKIASFCRVGERTVRSCLAQLEEAKLISIERKKVGLFSQNIYHMLDIPTGNTVPVGGGATGNWGPDQPEAPAPLTRLNEQDSISPPSSEGIGKYPSKKRSADPRYTEFVEILSKGYKGNKWDFGFGRADGSQLKELLRLRKDWTAKQFIAALKNYFQSEGVVPGALPRTYLVRLPNYHAGPLNKFNKLTESDKACAATENMR